MPAVPPATPVRLVAAGLLALLASGCGDREGVDPAPDPGVTAAGASVRLVDQADADLLLFVSNQSFDDAVVHLTVSVDGVRVVSGDFDVEGQHNWVSFPLAMAPGTHDITAESDSGASLRESFRTVASAPRYAVIDHWTENDTAELTWLFQREPVGFG